MSRLSLTLAFAVFALFAIIPQALMAQELKISATNTAQRNIFSKVQEPFEKATGVKLVFIKPKVAESYSYVVEMIEDRAEAAVAAATFAVLVDEVKKNGVAVPADLTHRVIGFDTLNILTHPKNGVSKLSIEQLTGLFAGGIKNWKQVGGADLPVTIIAYGNKHTRNTAIRRALLSGQPFGGTIKSVDGEEEEIVKAIASTPGAIGFETRDIESREVKKIETPPIGRPITLVNKGAPSKHLQTLITLIRESAEKK